jgi:hypothetical protein
VRYAVEQRNYLDRTNCEIRYARDGERTHSEKRKKCRGEVEEKLEG